MSRRRSAALLRCSHIITEVGPMSVHGIASRSMRGRSDVGSSIRSRTGLMGPIRDRSRVVLGMVRGWLGSMRVSAWGRLGGGLGQVGPILGHLGSNWWIGVRVRLGIHPESIWVALWFPSAARCGGPIGGGSIRKSIRGVGLGPRRSRPEVARPVAPRKCAAPCLASDSTSNSLDAQTETQRHTCTRNTSKSPEFHAIRVEFG